MAWNELIISGIAFSRDEAKRHGARRARPPGIAYQILGPIADANIDVDMIMQNVGHDGTTDLFIHRAAATTPARSKLLEEQIKPHIEAPRAIEGDNKIARCPRSAWACARTWASPRKMFRTLAEEGINIHDDLHLGNQRSRW
jgi:aspartate kinase